jgi:hypothetical protein
MRRVSRLPGGVILSLLVLSATASAQTGAADGWRRGTTLNLFGGAAATSNDQGPMAGGAVGWEVTPRIALEGSGTWFEWGHRAHAFGATLRTHVAIATARPVVPFLSGGVGLYRAWFRTEDTEMPAFYRRRMRDEPEGVGVSATFTDPSVVFGGGVNVFVSRHVAIRPDVEATVAMRNSRTHVVTTAAFHLAYHFEDRPITPARRTEPQQSP